MSNSIGSRILLDNAFLGGGSIFFFSVRRARMHEAERKDKQERLQDHHGLRRQHKQFWLGPRDQAQLLQGFNTSSTRGVWSFPSETCRERYAASRKLRGETWQRYVSSKFSEKAQRPLSNDYTLSSDVSRSPFCLTQIQFKIWVQ